MQNTRLILLLNAYNSGVINAAEQQELQHLAENLPEELWQETLLKGSNPHMNVALTEEEENRYLGLINQVYQIEQQINTPALNETATPVIKLQRWYKTKWAIAAAAIILIAMLSQFWPTKLKQAQLVQQAADTIDPYKANHSALLTLADGTVIPLDSLPSNQLTLQDGNTIQFAQNELQYQTVANAHNTVTYNTLTTPKGRIYSIVLSDGTKIWLNAMSSVKYPTAFDQTTREVTITGESYLEIAPNPQKPFIVHLENKQAIEVLGTSFNVNTYDQQLSASLFSGAIRVRTLKDTLRLTPGEQANLATSTATLIVKKLTERHLQQVLAWKQGAFNINGLTIQEFMREVERWYDFEVVYTSTIPDKIFHGEIGRDLKLPQILEVLKQFDIKYKLENKTLYIR